MFKILQVVVFAFLAFFLTAESYAQAKSWKKVCSDVKKAETCRLTQQLFLSQKNKQGKPQTVGRVLALTVIYAQHHKTKKREPYLSIQMPLGVDLRPGAVLKVDKGADMAVKYLRCTNAGCDASLKLDGKRLKAFKAGNHLFVGFRPWGSTKTTVLKASLAGFSKGIASIK
ncbi:invasion associated locus B family protein [Terasakiella sp. SH-1]|uniref:invasion associated locus B family protein n=1 Tax=Terasakiella sp. SH-1 TaxID=2560057 RepID=UPI0010742866|nr:invasion associated locus B family protein [Terasakiella sp. SH-1]